MDLPAPANKTPTLKRVREQFEHWRRSRGKRGALFRMHYGKPRVSVSQLSPANRISKVLRLNYTDLKHRVNARPIKL